MVPTNEYYEEITKDYKQSKSSETVLSKLTSEIIELEWIALLSDWEIATA